MKSECMKKTFLVLAVISLSLAASSQTFDEWFRQKETQKKYLVQQIAALQLFNDFLAGGYRIAKLGIDSISQGKKEDYRLHNDFFHSLQHIGAKVKGYKRVADIISFGYKILTQSKGAINDAKTSKNLMPEEVLYCTHVFQFLIGECLKAIDELIAITTDGERKMSEDERLRRIDKLFREMQRQYDFCCSFGENMAMLCRQRAVEQQDINHSKAINGLQ
jgi:hypothetical protein